MNKVRSIYEKGMHVEFTNKLSGSKYDGVITEINSDMVVVIDEYDNTYKVPFQWWNIKILN